MFAPCALALMSALLFAPVQDADEDLWADLLSDYSGETPSFDMSDPLELSLEEAIRLSFGNNLTVRAAELDAQAWVEGFGSAWGRFDTVLFADATGSRSVTAPTPTNIVGGVNVGGSGATKTNFYSATTGVRGLFLSGTSWEFGMGPQRVKTSANGGVSDVYTANWNLEMTHPLLRNGGDFERQGLELAAHDVRIASAGRDQTAIDTVELVVISYWNLVFSLQNLRTKRASVVLAEELVDITQRTFDQGLRNRIEVVEVEAELAQRQEELILAENTVSQAMDELRRQVFAPSDVGQFRRPLRPTTKALGDDAPAESEPLESMIAVALARRPDILQRRWELDRADIEVERAENQALSRFDLTAGYGINSNEDDMRSTLENLNDNQFDSASVTLSWERPFGNRTAGYALRRARVSRQRAGVLLRDVELLAVTDVRTEERNVRLQAQRVETTAESSRLNREVYEGEVRRLENDLSTPFQVRETLRNWLDAIDTELRARLDLEVSRVALSAAQGVLLESYGLVTNQPEPSLDYAPPAPLR